VSGVVRQIRADAKAPAVVGVEYIYANREIEDGLKGHLNRLQASAKYTF
jgi:hypothetical protein